MSAKYDKVVVVFWLDFPTLTGDWDEIIAKKEYAERGAIVEVPRKVEGYKNIIWYEPETYMSKILTEDTITVSDTDEMWRYYFGEAEVDTDNPAVPEEPTVPDTPIEPDTPTEPDTPNPSSNANTLSEQQITENVSNSRGRSRRND